MPIDDVRLQWFKEQAKTGNKNEPLLVGCIA